MGESIPLASFVKGNPEDEGPLLFVRGGALGDFVLTMPVLAALFATGRRVDLVCARKHLPLVRLCGSPGRTYDIEGVDSAWTFHGASPVDYAEAVCFSEQRAKALPISRVRWVGSRPAVGITAAHHFSSVWPSQPGLVLGNRQMPQSGQGPIVLAPGASNLAKSWPLDAWFALSATLHEWFSPVLLVGGPLEPWAEIRPDLPELIELLSAARAFIGPDSGPAHLARRLGVPTWVVMTEEERSLWAPHGATVVPGNTSLVDLVAGVRRSLGRG